MTPNNLLVRASLPTTAAVSAIRRAVAAVAPDVPVYSVSTMDEIVGNSLGARRLNLWLIGSFGVITLVLAAAGLYGVVAYTVAQRTREVGIRMALGAKPGDVLGMVVRQGVWQLGMGMMAGLTVALGISQLLKILLFDVQPRDPGIFGGVVAVLSIAGLLACILPARRATRVDPLLALRSD